MHAAVMPWAAQRLRLPALDAVSTSRMHFVVFDDVFVPWEHVFVFRDLALVRAQFFETPAHVLGNHQAQVRLVAKTRFLAGLALMIARTNGVDKLPPVMTQLGELASLAAVVEGMVLASEAAAVPDARGHVLPHRRFLYGGHGIAGGALPRRMVHLECEFWAGGGLHPGAVVGA